VHDCVDLVALELHHELQTLVGYGGVVDVPVGESCIRHQVLHVEDTIEEQSEEGCIRSVRTGLSITVDQGRSDVNVEGTAGVLRISGCHCSWTLIYLNKLHKGCWGKSISCCPSIYNSLDTEVV
jgi:hypothetical protein